MYIYIYIYIYIADYDQTAGAGLVLSHSEQYSSVVFLFWVREVGLQRNGLQENWLIKFIGYLLGPNPLLKGSKCAD